MVCDIWLRKKGGEEGGAVSLMPLFGHIHVLTCQKGGGGELFFSFSGISN